MALDGVTSEKRAGRLQPAKQQLDVAAESCVDDSLQQSLHWTESDVNDLIIPTEPEGCFHTDGYAISRCVLRPQLCAALIARLDAMLSGTFDTGVAPDKMPRAVPTRKPRVEQFVNAWKGDSLFAKVVHSKRLAEWVASLAGWPDGAEVLQDQVWCKPPGSGPIGFHRDTAYMGEGCVTAWITLDDLEPSLGPLEYARGSHEWEPAPYDGYTPALFGKKDYKSELDKAAAHNSQTPQVLQVIVAQGGGSVHDGRTWHGSGVNRSKRHRRGLGIHLCPRGARASNKTAFAKSLDQPSMNKTNEGYSQQPEAEANERREAS